MGLPLGKFKGITQQVGDYLRHRLRLAGCAQEVFAEDATLLTAEATGGVMRKIDVLATTALELSCESKSRLIDAGCIQKAVKVCAEAIT
jgi:type II secretory pathway predicted ATPase ExeA